ncbi:transcriptional antitermination N peptide [Providencia rettgeri]|uniref:transcriptional antitermination N peptide n=1 Tax=Providencia rettgeri TaxID=587 RepID=UPI003526807F
MCNFHGYNNARSRRMERRKALQEAHALTERLKAAIHGEPEVETKRPTLSLTRKPISRVEKAISIRSTKVYDSADNTCLPNSSIYSAKYRKSGTLLESGEVTARA